MPRNLGAVLGWQSSLPICRALSKHSSHCAPPAAVNRGSTADCWLADGNGGAAGLGGGNWVGLFGSTWDVVLIHEVRRAAGFIWAARFASNVPPDVAVMCARCTARVSILHIGHEGHHAGC